MPSRRPSTKQGALVVRLKRAYDQPSSGDGTRALVDRVWPRGVTKKRLKIDAWMRDIAPSVTLRRWFGHDPEKWEEFQQRYLKELADKQNLLQELAGRARQGKLTLVYGAHDPVHNQAVVLREVLEHGTFRESV